MVGSIEAMRRETGAVTPAHTAKGEPEPTFVLQTIRDAGALRALEPEWRALMATASPTAGVYQSFDWAAACASRLGSATKLCVLTVREQGRLVAVAPLVIDRRLGCATLCWLGGSLTIYGDVLAERAVDVSSWLARAFAQLAEQGEVHSIQLGNVRADARVAGFLASRGRATDRQEAPWIDMAAIGTFEAWRAGQSRSTRRSRARRLKQLEAMGKVGFAIEPAGARAYERITRLLEMKRDWADRRQILSRSIWSPDFEEVVTALVSGRSGLDARISMLTLDGTVIAMELGFVSDGVYTSYLGAYDPAFEEYSPGGLQLERTIEACFAEGMRAFDLQPPADAYKQSLAGGEVTVTSYALAMTRVGRLHSALAAVDPVGLAKRAITAMPSPCRSLAYTVARFSRGQREPRNAGRSSSDHFKRALLLMSAGGALAAAIAE
jgi:CelD/BcsL family acetyltransferase involved in cellulose biosynthesis